MNHHFDSSGVIDPPLSAGQPRATSPVAADTPFTLRFAAEAVQVACTGKLGARDIYEAQKAIYAHPTSATLRWVLFDLSHARAASIAPADVREFARRSRKFTEARAPHSLAVVAPGSLEFGLSRMFEAYVDPAVKVVVVRNRAEAIEWLVGEGADARAFAA